MFYHFSTIDRNKRVRHSFQTDIRIILTDQLGSMCINGASQCEWIYHRHLHDRSRMEKYTSDVN